MPDNFIGGLLKGLAGGIEANRKKQQDEEELKLKKKLADASIQLNEINRKKLEQEVAQKAAKDTQEQSLRDMIVGQASPEFTPAESQGGGAPLAEPSGARQGMVGNVQKGMRDAKLRASLIGLVPESQNMALAGVEAPMDPMVKAYIARAMGGLTPDQGAQPGEVAQGPALPPMDIGITAPPGKQPTVRINPQRQPLGAESRIFADYQKEQQALGKTPAEIRTGWQEYLKGSGSARASGAEQGRLGVRSTPQYQQTERDIGQARGQGREQGALDIQQTPGYQQTQQDIAASKGRGAAQVTAQRNRVGLQSAQFTLDTANQLLAQIPPPNPGLISRGLAFAQQEYAARAQTNPALASYEKLRKAYATQLSRSVLAEKGTLTDMDRQVVTENFADPLDVQEVRDMKQQTLGKFIRLIDKYEAAIQSGKPISDDDFRREFDAIAGSTRTAAAQPAAAQPKTAEEFIKSLVGQ